MKSREATVQCPLCRLDVLREYRLYCHVCGSLACLGCLFLAQEIPVQVLGRPFLASVAVCSECLGEDMWALVYAEVQVGFKRIRGDVTGV